MDTDFGKRITINISSTALAALDRVAGKRREQTGVYKYGVTNVATELIELVVSKYPVLLDMLTSKDDSENGNEPPPCREDLPDGKRNIPLKAQQPRGKTKDDEKTASK